MTCTNSGTILTIIIAVIWFIGFLITLGLIIWLRKRSSNSEPANSIQRSDYLKYMLQFLTVTLIFAVVEVLALQCKIDDQAAVAIISGVSGFVLRGFTTKPQTD